MSERIIDHAISSAGPVKTLIVLIAWTLFAFAGAYYWTMLPLLADAMLLGAIVIRRSGEPRHVCSNSLRRRACAAQLVPLPS
jgi:hypothetical protein